MRKDNISRQGSIPNTTTSCLLPVWTLTIASKSVIVKIERELVEKGSEVEKRRNFEKIKSK